MNLIDALSSHAHLVDSVVKLSQAECFKRKYSSITDAIADGAVQMDWSHFMQLIAQYTQDEEKPPINPFVIDCTPQPRLFSRKLTERSIIHAPNPAPGNKPICVGHQYSICARLPQDKATGEKHWLVPMGARRVTLADKSNEVGMAQALPLS